MSEKPENKSETETLYELGFHLLPTLSEEEVQKEFNGIKEQITKSNGGITTESAPALLDLQYTMVQNIDSVNHKYETAHFGWVKFTADPDAIAEIEEHLDSNMNVLRRLIIKNIAEANVPAEEVAKALDKDESDDEEGDKKGNTDKVEEKKEDKKDSEEKSEEPKDAGEEAAEASGEGVVDEVDKAIDELVEDKA